MDPPMTTQETLQNAPHPKGFWILTLASSLNVFGFGFLLSNLLQYFHSLSINIAQATTLFAVFISILYGLPAFGGYLADRFGFRSALIIGTVFSLIGSLLIAIPAITPIEWGLSLYVMGACLSTATTIGLIGLQYKLIPYKRDAGLSLFYVIFNAGYLVAGLLGAYLVQTVGYSWSMVIFTLSNLGALIIFCFVHTMVIGLHPGSEPNAPSKRFWFYLAYTVLGMGLCFVSFRHPIVNSILFWMILVGCFVYFYVLARKIESVNAKKQILAFAVLCLLGVAYNVIYNMEFELLPYFYTSSMNPHLGPWTLPNDLVTPLDPVYCVLLGPLFSMLWAYLGRRNRNLALPTKFALGLMFAAAGYYFLAILLSFSMNQLLPSYWLLVAFFLFVVGELLVVPIGYAMAPQLAPAGQVSTFSSIWMVMNGFAAVLGGYIGSDLAINLHDPLLQRNQAYHHTFVVVATVVMGLGLLFFIFLRPWVKRLITTD